VAGVLWGSDEDGPYEAEGRSTSSRFTDAGRREVTITVINSDCQPVSESFAIIVKE